MKISIEIKATAIELIEGENEAVFDFCANKGMMLSNVKETKGFIRSFAIYLVEEGIVDPISGIVLE